MPKERATRTRLKTPQIASRVPIFAPTRRATERISERVETAWGCAVISGRLGQRHRDVLDAISFTMSHWKETGDGGVMVFVDPAHLRTALGREKYTYRQILDILRDLRKATIVLRDHATKRVIETSPVLVVEYGDEIERSEDRRLQGRIREWIITISSAWVQLYATPHYYPPAVLRLKRGVSQAVVRLMLSHKPGATYRIDTALDAVGVPATGQARRDARRRLDIAPMDECGVVVRDGHVVRREDPGASKRPGRWVGRPQGRR